MPTIISGDNGVDKVQDGVIVTADIADLNVTPAKLSQKLTSGTSVASTSGTSIDFTGIPSWAKRITVMFNGVSTNGASHGLVQLGGSGGIENTGYISATGGIGSAGAAILSSTAGFMYFTDSANYILHGSLTISNISGNSWVISGVLASAAASPAPYISTSGGSKTLSTTLDRIRITTVSGTNTFDAGSINILYE